jgi:hypothetical protein
MLVPKLNSVWQYKGSGNGRGDIQRVIGVDEQDEAWKGEPEIVTMSERPFPHLIEWSWLGSVSDFVKHFTFLHYDQNPA